MVIEPGREMQVLGEKYPPLRILAASCLSRKIYTTGKISAGTALLAEDQASLHLLFTWHTPGIHVPRAAFAGFSFIMRYAARSTLCFLLQGNLMNVKSSCELSCSMLLNWPRSSR